VAVAGVGLSPSVAGAAACCGESHGLGERLATAERAGVTTSVRWRERFGAWSPRGEYGALPEGDHDRELRLDLGWLVRVGHQLQLGASVPALATWRSLGGRSSSGGGVGDVTALARWDLVPVTGWKALPGVALTFAATLPTGRGPQRADDPLAADVTGLGTAEVRPGLAFEKNWDSGWFATLLASVAVRTSYQARGVEIDLAPRWQLAGLAGPRLSTGLSFGLGLLFEAEAAPAIDGATSAGGGRRRTAALAFGAYDLSPRWTLLASAAVDLPIGSLGQSDSLAVAPSVGARFVWGEHD
jgi:hypothetical protein